MRERQDDDPRLWPRCPPSSPSAKSKKVAPGPGAPGSAAGRRTAPRSRTCRMSAPAKSGRVDVYRVGGRGDEGGVTGTDQHPHQVRQALLGPDGGHHLVVRVELDTEFRQVQVAHGPPELGDPLGRRVAVVAQILVLVARRQLAGQ